MFRGLIDKFSRASKEAQTKSIDDISEVIGDSGRKLKASALDDLLHDLELGLLEADVALPVAEELTNRVKTELDGKRIDKTFDIDDAIKLALKAAVREVLSQQTFSPTVMLKSKPPPFVIMFVGLNGGGETTSIEKLAFRMKKHGLRCVLSAG